MLLSERIREIKPSATLALNAKALAMRAEGIDVVSFGVGEPDFDTPEHIRSAAIRAIEEGFTRYTAVGGIPELKQALAGARLEPMRRAVDGILALSDARSVAAALREAQSA